ncbi:MAG: C4-dicarboxylate ABC transporter [Burkholderiales bacterium PBB6]|nr:MAG: C4-dicarboxylate ABC transporter [Burkholderiales bacterium PBB6]
MAAHPTPLKFLVPGWYAVPMGLCGLALAWHRAAPLMGEMADAVALVAGAVAALVFGLLLVATVLRWQRHPEAWAEDRAHPVRHSFIATLPIAAALLATVGVSLFGPHPALEALWWAGSLGLLLVTRWVLTRWWLGNRVGGLQWLGITPALFIPVVGNVLVPLAGVPLGHPNWSAAQFGVGLLFWPVITVLLMVRIGTQGMLPERLLPTMFILIAPPTVAGLSALQLGAPEVVGWVAWGMAAFSFVWVGALANRIKALAFSMTHWALSFPVAAFAALTLRLATPGSPMAVLGPLLLALSSLIILGLAAGTLRGLREGTLLAPEPVATIVPASTP